VHRLIHTDSDESFLPITFVFFAVELQFVLKRQTHHEEHPGAGINCRHEEKYIPQDKGRTLIFAKQCKQTFVPREDLLPHTLRTQKN